jgi:hypothetical protein
MATMKLCVIIEFKIVNMPYVFYIIQISEVLYVFLRILKIELLL